MAKPKTAVADEEQGPVDFFCPVCREHWESPEAGHPWEFKPQSDGPDRLECPLFEATIIRVSKFGL